MCSRANPSCKATHCCGCTPHIGFVEQDSYELFFGLAFDNVINFIRNEPSHLVNPEALKVLR